MNTKLGTGGTEIDKTDTTLHWAAKLRLNVCGGAVFDQGAQWLQRVVAGAGSVLKLPPQLSPFVNKRLSLFP